MKPRRLGHEMVRRVECMETNGGPQSTSSTSQIDFSQLRASGLESDGNWNETPRIRKASTVVNIQTGDSCNKRRDNEVFT